MAERRRRPRRRKALPQGAYPAAPPHPPAGRIEAGGGGRGSGHRSQSFVQSSPRAVASLMIRLRLFRHEVAERLVEFTHGEASLDVRLERGRPLFGRRRGGRGRDGGGGGGGVKEEGRGWRAGLRLRGRRRRWGGCARWRSYRRSRRVRGRGRSARRGQRRGRRARARARSRAASAGRGAAVDGAAAATRAAGVDAARAGDTDG